MARQRATLAQLSLLQMSPDKKAATVRSRWARAVQVRAPRSLSGLEPAAEAAGPIRVTKVLHGIDQGVYVPLLVLFPRQIPKSGSPLVVAVSQSGKAAMLKKRSREIAELLASGIAVALADLRGTGETRPGTYRGRRSYATGLSSGELMLGETLVGQRLHDLLVIVGRMSTTR